MKAAIVHGANDIRLEEVPQPVPEPGDIVVRVRASGICATDVKTLLGQGLPKDLPIILGHEVAGEVSSLGKGWKALRSATVWRSTLSLSVESATTALVTGTTSAATSLGLPMGSMGDLPSMCASRVRSSISEVL